MKKITVSRILITFLVCVGLVFLFSGCAKKPAETAVVEEAPPAEEAVAAVELEEAESVMEEVVIAEEPVADLHVVKKGECLWWIAEYEDVYNDPFMWPLIFSANKDKINNPDLIYPGQELTIPRAGVSMAEIEEARKNAGAPRPYTPPEGAVVPAY